MAEEKQNKSIDPAALEMLAKAAEDSCSTVFDRAEKTKPCPIGADGSCCKNCAMGPCRLVGKAERGVCGATIDRRT
jgi:carbon-monoxide dehydrogenase catalytic subunit